MQRIDSVFAFWDGSALIGQANGNLFWLVLYVLFPVLLLLLLGFLSWSLRQRQKASVAPGEPVGTSNESFLATEPVARSAPNEGNQNSISPPKSRVEGAGQGQRSSTSREPDFSDFNFDEDSAEMEVDAATNRNQGFDLAAPENTEFDLHEGEQEDLLDEMYREDEQLSNSDSSFHADDTDVEEEKPEPPKKKPQFQTHDEFSVDDDLHDDEDLDLSDDTEQDFDTCLEVDSSASDSFGVIGSVAKDQNANVLDDDEKNPRRAGASPEDTAVGLDVSELELIDETLQLLESANAELEKVKRLNNDLLDDRTYLNSRLQENEELIGKLNENLTRVQDENNQQVKVADKLRADADALREQLIAAKDSPSELQTKLLSELQTELVESQQRCRDLENQLKSVISDRDQFREMISDAELNVPESVVAELKLLTEQVEELKAEGEKTLRKTAENGKPE